MAEANPDGLTILQYALGLGITAGGALAGFFGVRSKLRDRDEPRERSQGPALEVYVDGPITQALVELKKVATAVEHMAVSGQSLAALREEFGEKLRLSRHEIYAKLHEQAVQFEQESAALEKRLRDAERLAAVLDERVVSLQARLPRRT